MAQKTAVESLYENLFPKQLDGFSEEEWKKIDTEFEKAKQIEKEQKMKFAADFFRWWWNQKGSNTDEAVKQYYNETHGGNE